MAQVDVQKVLAAFNDLNQVQKKVEVDAVITYWAEIHKVHPRTIKRYIGEGFPLGFSAAFTEARREWINLRNAKNKERRAPTTKHERKEKADLEREKLRTQIDKHKASVTLARIEIGKAKGQLIPTETANGIIADVVSIYNSRLEDLPDRIVSQLPETVDTVEVRATIVKHIDDTRKLVSATLTEIATQ